MGGKEREIEAEKERVKVKEGGSRGREGKREMGGGRGREGWRETGGWGG